MTDILETECEVEDWPIKEGSIIDFHGHKFLITRSKQDYAWGTLMINGIPTVSTNLNYNYRKIGFTAIFSVAPPVLGFGDRITKNCSMQFFNADYMANSLRSYLHNRGLDTTMSG